MQETERYSSSPQGFLKSRKLLQGMKLLQPTSLSPVQEVSVIHLLRMRVVLALESKHCQNVFLVQASDEE